MSRMTDREIQVVGDFFATLSPYMIGLLSKPEVQEIAQNTALVKFIQRERQVQA